MRRKPEVGWERLGEAPNGAYRRNGMRQKLKSGKWGRDKQHIVQARARTGKCVCELWGVGSWCVTGARRRCENSLFQCSLVGGGSSVEDGASRRAGKGVSGTL